MILREVVGPFFLLVLRAGGLLFFFNKFVFETAGSRRDRQALLVILGKFVVFSGKIG